jgi:hypothetical protein
MIDETRVLAEDHGIVLGNDSEDLSGDWKSLGCLSELEMEVGDAQQESRSVRGSSQHLRVAVAGAVYLSRFQKGFSEVGPAMGVVRISLERAPETFNSRVGALFRRRPQVLAGGPHNQGVVAKKEPAENALSLHIIRESGFKEDACGAIDDQDPAENKCQPAQILGLRSPFLPLRRFPRSLADASVISLRCSKAVRAMG